ncbi:12848_t:CDS:2 [Funneliformis caledonium]|uniref:12848_t:CDS:1 n=1 Tax=Funneliformis caledonium TaxID=1117310 RepID=A0A9N9EAP6_9GLOM|nr:12848_t:CDS:2 [Funneliformis caledonium]
MADCEIRRSIKTFKEDEIRNANRLFDEKSGTLSGKFNNNSTESKIATINCEYNVLKRDFETKKNGCEIHDGCVNSLRSTNECTGSESKGTEHADFEMGSRHEECPNRRTIGEMQTRFGKLLRIGSLGGNAWKPTTPQKTCRLVHAHSRYTQEGSSIECHKTMSQVSVCVGKDESPSCCDNTLILVDTFEDKSRIANSITLRILDSDPKELIYYITCITEFGFDHIIIIGETYGGVICYGRVFLWDDENLLKSLIKILSETRRII